MLVAETNEMDTEDEKSADQLRLLMRKHYTVGGLTDVLSVFGPVKDDVRTDIALSRHQLTPASLTDDERQRFAAP